MEFKYHVIDSINEEIIFTGTPPEIFEKFEIKPNHVNRASRTGCLVKGQYNVMKEYGSTVKEFAKPQLYAVYDSQDDDFIVIIGTRFEVEKRFDISSDTIWRSVCNGTKFKGRYEIHAI